LTERATAIFEPRPHFQCYRVDQRRREVERLAVTLEDQFGPVKTRLGEITKICAPVSKNGEGIPDKELHLVCYKIMDPHDPQQRVVTANQFGNTRIYVRESQELCVPSFKRELDRK
jgi:hypothetical protein